MKRRPLNLAGTLPSHAQLKLMVRRAESALFELVLHEPSGTKEVRLAMLEDCRDVLGRCRMRLQIEES